MASYNENSKVSGNAFKGRPLKRMEIEYKNLNIKFAVNPTDFTQTKPNRATITQTKGGAWIDAWGAGIVEFTIKGTTGVKGGTSNIDTGYQRWKNLEKLFDTLYDAITDGQEVKDLIKFYNHTDNIFYYCYPTQNGIELFRSVSKPHLYQYTIHLWGIRKIGQPATTSGTIGNPNKTKSTGTTTVTSKNQSSIYKGGDSYTSRNRMLNSEVDVETVTNTRTKTIADIHTDCLEHLTNLAPLIGGNNGKISPITGFQCTNSLIIQDSGMVTNIRGFDGTQLNEKLDSVLLVETKYINKVSTETYELYTKIREYSPEVLSPDYSIITGETPKQRVIQAANNSTSYDSTIYELTVDYRSKFILYDTEVNYIKQILLESMMVYIKLYDLYNQPENLSTSLTLTNLNVLIKNIQAMIMYFTFSPNNINLYKKQDISSELRRLEKVLTQICSDILIYL